MLFSNSIKHLSTFIKSSILFTTLILILSNAFSCSSEPIMNNNNKSLIENFALRLSSKVNNVDTTESKMIKEALFDIGEFLFIKDENSFKELNKKSNDITQPKKLINELFSQDFLQLSTQFYNWSDQKVKPAEYLFDTIKTQHFIIFYPSLFSKKKIKFLGNESEIVFNELNKIFKPDKKMIDNFDRLAIYESWRNLNFKENKGKLYLTNSKIPLLITRTKKEMKDLANVQHPENIGGLTTFSISLATDTALVWFPCRVNINYSTPLSLVALTHEITHAFISVIYSKPWILDSALVDYGRNSFPDISNKLGLKVLFRPSLLTVEGPAYWAQWKLGLFSRIGLLPTATQILSNFNEKPDLKKLIKGDIDISIFSALFGDTSKQLGEYFTSLASFMGYLIEDYPSNQLYALFASGSEDITPQILEEILHKPFDQIDSEWLSYIKAHSL
jgi:hypothetical protein